MDQIRKNFLEKINIDEAIAFNSIWVRVEQHGLMMEVIYTALEQMKEFPESSPLLCLQIAASDWDI